MQSSSPGPQSPTSFPAHLRILAGPGRSTGRRLQRLAAALALRGAVRWLICGNRYAPYDLASDLARRTGAYHDILEQHVMLARAETGHQTLTLLEQTPESDTPTLIGDVLAGLYDEALPVGEADELLFLILVELRRLKAAGLVVATAAPNPERPGLLAALLRSADVLRAT